MGTNAKVIETAYAAFGRGDIPALMGLLTDDVEWVSPRTLPHGGEYHGPSEVLQFFEKIGAAWDPLALEVQVVDEVGDLVVGVVRADGVLREGKPAGYGATHVFRVTDGKISDFHEYVDVDAAIA